LPCRSWSELTTIDVAALDKGRAIAVLPIAATEQHGPHLPLGTDWMIAEGMLGELAPLVPDRLEVVVLPIEALGASAEHGSSPGTLSLPPEMALSRWLAIGAAVAAAGLRRLVVVSSHGGNSEVMGLLVRELRLRHGMLAVATSWSRMGFPDGLFPAAEIAYGWHGGAVETSLMLAFRPELVRIGEARRFDSLAQEMEAEFALLRPTGKVAFGWAAQDVNPAGVVGDATLATAEKGRQIAAHQAKQFVSLLEDAARFDLARLRP
jgi:creatinine amidohydrolase